MWFNPIFERFVEKSPVTVILRALMEVVLTSSKLDGELREKVGFLKAWSAFGRRCAVCLRQALRGRNSDNLAGEQREAVEQMGSEGLVRVNQTIKTKDGINTTIILKFANRG